jgi:cell division protein FtsI (penicillin-binding protein 3)
MQPRLVKAEFDVDGRETRRFEPKAVRQVISAETATTLGRILTRVVDDGTGHLAAVPGYDVGGKTGTAQKMDPATRRYSRAPGVLSFVGFVPVQAPRLVMLVLLDEPKTQRWGSEAAAPVFAAIAGPVLRYLDVAPRDTVPIQIVTGAGAETPAAASPRAAPAVTPALAAEAGMMPDLRGSTLRQALAALMPRGVRVEITGRGRVMQQVPAPGDALEADAVARLTLAPSVVRVVQRGPEPAREAVQ